VELVVNNMALGLVYLRVFGVSSASYQSTIVPFSHLSPGDVEQAAAVPRDTPHPENKKDMVKSRLIIKSWMSWQRKRKGMTIGFEL
jgi:hypothetical protein